MPDFLIPVIYLFTLIFDAIAVFKLGKSFHKQGHNKRVNWIEAWRCSLIAPCRDLIRYYESLALLAWTADAASLGASFPKKKRSYQNIKSLSRRCQVAVIGSGPGGAVTASILAETGIGVSLFEEGHHLGLDSCGPFSAEEMVQKYRNGGLTLAFGKPKVAYVEGTCVGGGSEVNSGLYHRTPPEILGKWQEDYGLQISETELLPHFKACEQALTVGKSPGPLPAASLKLEEGARKLGWFCQEVPRWFAYDGGRDRLGIPTGKRQSMSQTFIGKFEASGGRLISDCRVEKIKPAKGGFDIQIASGTEFNAETIFLAGGAIGTPALLQRSGIRGRFGRNLQMHPTIKVVAEFEEEVNSDTMGVPVHQVKEFAPAFSFGCSISTRPYLALALLDHPEVLPRLAESWKRMAIYYAMIVPEGRGSVRAMPRFKDPLVSFSCSRQDLGTLAVSLQRLCQLLFAAGAVRLFPTVRGLGPYCNNADLSQIPAVLPVDRTNLMSIHLFSTCPIGERADRRATDSWGRIPGYSGLRVADGSLLPTAPGVNPQGSIMGIARRNAFQFLDERVAKRQWYI